MIAREFIKALPKCEQHLHIEGTLEPAHAFALAEKNKMTLPASHFTTVEAAEERYKHFTSLDDFLGYYNAAMEVLLHEEDFTELGTAYFDRVHADGLVHAEIFVDPQAHTERGVSLQAVFGGLKKAQELAKEKYGITSILSACFVRHLSVDSAMKMVDNMQPWVADGTVVGLGCDSTELGNPRACNVSARSTYVLTIGYYLQRRSMHVCTRKRVITA
jgi:adenosine deaminase